MLQLMLIKHIIISVLPCASPSVCIYSVSHLPLRHELFGVGTVLSLNLYSPEYNRAPNLHLKREMMALTMETFHVVEGDYFQCFHGELLGRCF